MIGAKGVDRVDSSTREANRGPAGAERGIVFPPEKTKKMTIFGSFSGLSEPSVVGDYKKSVSRASPASMS